MDEVENLFSFPEDSGDSVCPCCGGRGFIYDEVSEGLVECPVCFGGELF